MRISRRRAGVLVSAGLAVALTAITGCSGQTATVGGSGSGDSKTISVSLVAGWDEDTAATYLWKEILSEHGYTVNVQSLDIASTFTGVANKQVDLYFDAWLPNTHQTYWEKFGDKLEVETTWYQPATDDLAVPSYVNDVNSIADLASRASEFGGQIVGIEAGSGLMRLTQNNVMPAYGLNGEYQLVSGSSPAMLADLKTAIDQKKPIVVTLWQPHWAFTQFPLKPLADPKGAFGQPDQVQVIAAKGFGSSHPELARWLSKFKLDSGQLGSLELLIRQKGQGHEQDAVKEWIQQNKALVDSWTS
ncbi:MAG TPA: glycine betaine ABC transporter substrate-binding protein [Amycolatopsis sp.]|uniref:glycine betaine ABC transporter substrate-binding protein n=1 Tax=Amycolatopsis sp. TaxID=37632 RepID=UPI002B468CEF|nr:glycine betaine ABC transporter substrate-binding protein [Amycolatopsis sp.]HKS47524.1 glycine betaine ABC transporter substrate-binding protein [Amycolatopsis sp.]